MSKMFLLIAIQFAACYDMETSGVIMNAIFTAIVHKEKRLYVAECLETGTASQGKTIEKAVRNLRKATELHLEEFQLKEKHSQPFLTTFEISSHS